MKRLTAALFAALTCIGAQATTPASTATASSADYLMTELPLTATDMNDNGVIVGYTGTNDAPRAAVYASGQLTMLPGAELGYTDMQAMAISNAGHIVGNGSTDDTQPSHVLFWPNLQAAPVDTGIVGFPRAVSSQGVVVGYVSSLEGLRAFRWSAAAGMTLIHPPAALNSIALDISDTGYVVGEVSFGEGREIARWNPSGAYGIVARSGFPSQILDNGSIVGKGYDRPPSEASLWSISNTRSVLTTQFHAQWMTATGRLIGVTPGTAGDAMTQESLTSPATRLPVPAGAFSYAKFADTCGTIVGWVGLPTGRTISVVWKRPVCDPFTTTTVPEVRGYQLDLAAQRLVQASLFAGRSTYVSGPCADIGRITAQSPGSNVQAATASFVDLTLIANCNATAPDLRGLTVSGAGTATRAAGLVLGPPRSATDNSCNNIGLVMHQSPLQGTTLTWGSTITVTIGQRPRTPCP